MARYIDLRDRPLKERNTWVFEEFEELDNGETLTLINDHYPHSLMYQMYKEKEGFELERCEVIKMDNDLFYLEFPKTSKTKHD